MQLVYLAILALTKLTIISSLPTTERTLFNTFNRNNAYPAETLIEKGQAAGIQFQIPAGMEPIPILTTAQVVLFGGSVPTTVRMYIASDSGYDTVNLSKSMYDAGLTATVPDNTDITVTADFSALKMSLLPGAKYWFIVENAAADDSYNTGFTWLGVEGVSSLEAFKYYGKPVWGISGFNSIQSNSAHAIRLKAY